MRLLRLATSGYDVCYAGGTALQVAEGECSAVKPKCTSIWMDRYPSAIPSDFTSILCDFCPPPVQQMLTPFGQKVNEQS